LGVHRMKTGLEASLGLPDNLLYNKFLNIGLAICRDLNHINSFRQALRFNGY